MTLKDMTDVQLREELAESLARADEEQERVAEILAEMTRRVDDQLLASRIEQAREEGSPRPKKRRSHKLRFDG